jgi:hypothetical protein
MADKIRLTQDLKLPPGVTVTPDHVVPEFRDAARPGVSDRRIDADGKPEDLGNAEHLSTYKYERQPEAPVDESALPRESVNEANAPAGKK